MKLKTFFFLLECDLYRDIRNKYHITQQPYKENKEELISDILVFQKLKESEILKRKNLICDLWYERKKIKGSTGKLKRNKKRKLVREPI